MQNRQPHKKNEGLMVCADNHIMRIVEYRDNMYIMRCAGGETETGFPDDHIYFHHPKAVTQIGEVVRLPSFKGDEEEQPAEPKKNEPEPCVNIGNIKVYNCKGQGCGSPVSQEQAVKSFELVGRALCKVCLGKEMVS